MTKLTNEQIRFICRHIVDFRDWSVKIASLHYGVSERRIQQLTRYYRRTGYVPKLNPNRRPKALPLTKEEKQLIDQIWEKYRFRARMTYKHLKSQGTQIPLHKIHRHLVRSGRSKRIQTNRKSENVADMNELTRSVYFMEIGIEVRSIIHMPSSGWMMLLVLSSLEESS